MFFIFLIKLLHSLQDPLKNHLSMTSSVATKKNESFPPLHSHGSMYIPPIKHQFTSSFCIVIQIPLFKCLFIFEPSVPGSRDGTQFAFDE